jgi:DNA polymerase-1
MTEEKKRPRLVLVDGSNYLFRAFYAIRELTNSKGFPTNAIYGFTTMLMKLLRDQAPDYIAIAFDVKGPTFRHEAFADYKATRRAIPDTLIPQIPYVKEVVRGFAIPVLEQQGIEADDIIGTIARRQAAEGMEVVIVSGDKDMMQLVSPDIIMVDTMKDKIYDVAAVKERFGVPPEKVVEVLGLMGDASDNIPGVPGIGPKGALRLIEQFGGVEEILAHPEKIHNLKTREAILAHADQAKLSRELAQIRTDAAITFDLEACRRSEPDRELLISLFREFEFSSLLQEFKTRGEEAAGDYRIVRTEEELDALVFRLGQVREFSLEPILSSAEAMRASLVGVAVSPSPGEGFYIPTAHDDGSPQLSTGAVMSTLAPFLADPSVAKHEDNNHRPF